MSGGFAAVEISSALLLRNGRRRRVDQRPDQRLDQRFGGRSVAANDLALAGFPATYLREASAKGNNK
jgi:hypothetical protein